VSVCVRERKLSRGTAPYSTGVCVLSVCGRVPWICVRKGDGP
jgi:hypothetical protein